MLNLPYLPLYSLIVSFFTTEDHSAKHKTKVISYRLFVSTVNIFSTTFILGKFATAKFVDHLTNYY